MTEIRKRKHYVSVLKSTKLVKELTNQDKYINAFERVYNHFIESLILAQDERWRRA